MVKCSVVDTCKKYSPKTGWLTRDPYFFSSVFLKIFEIKYYEYHGAVFLANSMQMSIRWAPCDNFEFYRCYIGAADLLGAGGRTKTKSRAAIFGQGVSGVAAHLIFPYQFSRLKSFFWGDTLNAQCLICDLWLCSWKYGGLDIRSQAPKGSYLVGHRHARPVMLASMQVTPRACPPARPSWPGPSGLLPGPLPAVCWAGRTVN